MGTQATSEPAASSSLNFRLRDPSQPSFSPRVGEISLSREDTSNPITIQAPNFLSLTSRGAIPHLSRDNVRKTDAIRWVHVPFESFLEQSPPVPTLYPHPKPLHGFLGFPPDRHIVSVSLRNWNDDKDIPANGKNTVSARCVRGVRTVTPADYNAHIAAIKPDITFALSDIPITPTAPSEKRVVKSLERSLLWLGQLLRLSPPNVFVHMAGGWSDVSRDDFATGLLEPLEGAEARELGPLGYQTLDEGVTGYSFDLAPLRKHGFIGDVSAHERTQALVDLIRTSLRPLPESKPRLVTGTESPHEILAFIRSGVDLFDSHFAQTAAEWGVALDFTFPAPLDAGDGPVEVGWNLYDPKHEMDFHRLSDSFAASAEHSDNAPTCPCIACSPKFSPSVILHSSIDEQPSSHHNESIPQPFTRAYIHHLLHTHEMTAHALLASHNLSVLASFFHNIQTLPQAQFDTEVSRFEKWYRRPDALMEEAKRQCEEVNFARGKGRLAREKAAKIVGETGGLEGGVLDAAVAQVSGEVSPAAGEVAADEILGG